MENRIRYEYIDDYIRKTIKRKTGQLFEMEQYANTYGVPIIQPEVVNLIEVIGRLKKPKKILEVGTAIGYSTLVLEGILAEDGSIDTIEISEDIAKIARANIEKAKKLDRINMIIGDALEVLECLNKSYDMIFMDAAKGQYIEMLPECLRLLKKEGVLITDNVLFKGLIAKETTVHHKNRTIYWRLRDYLNQLCSSDELDTTIIPISDGVTISYKK